MKRLFFSLLLVLLTSTAQAQKPPINGVAGPTLSNQLRSIMTDGVGSGVAIFPTNAPNGVLVTDGSSLPSISSTLPAPLTFGATGLATPSQNVYGQVAFPDTMRTYPGDPLTSYIIMGAASRIYGNHSGLELNCVSRNAVTTSSASGTVLTVASVLSGSNQINVGDVVAGSGYTTPTVGITIASFGTGTGGIGTYNLSSNVGTVGSEQVIIGSGQCAVPFQRNLFNALNASVEPDEFFRSRSPYKWATVTASISSTTATVTNVSAGVIVPGQTIQSTGGNVTANTQVVAQLTGTGGAPCPDPTCNGGIGTYSVSISQTVTSRSMVFGTVAAQAFDTVGMTQYEVDDGFGTLNVAVVNVQAGISAVSACTAPARGAAPGNYTISTANNGVMKGVVTFDCDRTTTLSNLLRVNSLGATGVSSRTTNSTVTGSISATTLTVTASNLANPIVAGLTISGVNNDVTANTNVLAQLTGTGGASCPDPTCTGGIGTYSVSTSQTVSSESMSIGPSMGRVETFPLLSPSFVGQIISNYAARGLNDTLLGADYSIIRTKITGNVTGSETGFLEFGVSAGSAGMLYGAGICATTGNKVSFQVYPSSVAPACFNDGGGSLYFNNVLYANSVKVIDTNQNGFFNVALANQYIAPFSAPTISGGALTLNLANGPVFNVANNANATVTFSGVQGGKANSFAIYATADGTLRTWSWPGSVKWPGAVVPTFSSTNGYVDRIGCETNDGGTTWFCALTMLGSH